MQKYVPFRETRSAKYPEPVHIVIIKDRDNKYNPMSAAWVMFTSIDPPMLAVSVGFQRYTYELFKRNREFVISIPSQFMAQEVSYFGNFSGRDEDKLAALGTKTQPAQVIDGVILAEASANYECRLTGSLTTGDHVIFAGEVVASHIHTENHSRIFTLEQKVFGGVDPQG